MNYFNSAFCFPSHSCLFLMNYRSFYLFAFLLIVVWVLAFFINRQREKGKKREIKLLQFQKAIDNAYDHLIITDIKGVAVYVNKAIERLTGFASEEVLGKKPGQLWGGQMDKAYYKKMWQTIAIRKKTFLGEITNKRKNGELYYAKVSISPILDKKNNVLYYVGIERDITREKELDQAKSDFISIVSHQLRTPLTIIKGYVSMLLESSFGPLTEQQLDVLRKVSESNERDISLVADLLNISRIESGKIQFVFAPDNLAELTESAVGELAGVAKEKGLDLQYNKPANLPLASMDKDKLRQVIMNLIDNSIKYTSSGFVKIALEAKGKNLRFTLEDSGLGIKPEEMQALFQKYSRGSESSNKSKVIKGTGLGLYVCKMIIDAHKGKIWAESAGEGKGSKFIFELPITQK